jgi:N-acetylneuraminic acid mutarotase
VYVFGGGGADFKSLSSVEAYDPAADRWEPCAPMPAPRSGIAAAALSGRIYVMGGGFRRPDGSFDFKSVVEAYDPQGDRWEAAAPLLHRHDAPAALALDGEVLLFGGHHPDASGGPLTDPAFDVCEALAPGGTAWREIAPLPTPRFSLACVAMPDGVWAMGGGAFREGAFRNLDVIEVYDPLGGVWGRAPTRLPWPGAGLYAAAHGGAVYVAGGNDGDRISDRVARYDLAANAWAEMPPLPEGRVMGALVSTGDALRLIGGRGPDGKAPTASTFRLEPG